MRQLMLGFASQRGNAVPLRPEIEEQVVTLMAQAIVAVADDGRVAQGGKNDDADAIEQQDQEGAPEA